ncbi:conserved repeat domain-containing protein [Saccharopolyspora antimicrobica]|uniref:Conserved repeat domain-containing protein n=1 Tax=Saccharopolyspora antimicrobica TaxID=455193 RepID=A0A1I4U3X1_9PSEU|nr:hypothetical protein [Saccharopolyspora antimicrobica]RKT88665.1 putative repeat protein (TIGR01451 family) [Saccharopolyspora antimicrobica]SFM83511.1 conserved repeat domain-containing protein [Saccharopolyspora antimicrobica]
MIGGSMRLGITLLGVFLVLSGLIAIPVTEARPHQRPAPEPARIAFSGTGHRSLGIAEAGPYGGTEPLFGEPRQHFDQDVSARGGTMVFTSLRDEAAPQVYLRTHDGHVQRLTRGRDAANPELSPDGRWVAFDSASSGQRDVWLVRTDGSEAHRLTSTPGDEVNPTFSPDGTRIAYAANSSGRWQIHARPAGGGAERQLTAEPNGAATQPAWNPVDEDRIAYTFAVNGEQTVRVLRGTGTGTPLPVQAREPRWMPDGQGLLFLSPRSRSGAADGIDRVYLADADSPNPPRLLLEEDRSVDSPTWWRGQLVVARTTAPLRNTARLQDVQVDGTDPRDLGSDVLTEDPKAVEDSMRLFKPEQGDPWTQRQSYSPDGKQIAVSRFETVRGRRVQRIWLVASDGSDPRPLPIADRWAGDWETDAAWSPDGEEIAVARRSPGGLNSPGPSRIVVVNVRTGEVTKRLANADPQLDDTQPAWSPDGRSFAFSRGRPTDDDPARRENHIWLTDARTFGSQRDLSDVICECLVVDDSPVFAPDSRSIVFNREKDGLYRMDLNDDSCEVLLPRGQNSCVDQPRGDGPFQPRDVSWSADGRRLVLSHRAVADENAPEHLSVLDLATGELSSLTGRLPGRQKEPTWQPTVDLGIDTPPEQPQVRPGEVITAAITVRNQGPSDAPDTETTLQVPPGLRLTDMWSSRGTCEGEKCSLGTLEPGDAVEVTAQLVAVVVGEHRLVWTITSAVHDTDEGDNTNTTVIIVTPTPAPPPPPPPPASPGVALTVGPDTSYVGGRTGVTFTVRNTGSSTATGLVLDMALPPGVPVVHVPPGCTAAQCALPDLPPGGVLARQVVLAPDAALTSEIRARLRTSGTDADPGDNDVTAPYRVLQPRIVAVPAVGEPGFVTSVRGVDFPPGIPVRLEWSPGITAAAAPTSPAPDGRFAAQLLILPNDQVGPRTITASGPGFSPVTAEFLVVASPIAPPELVEWR